MDRFIGYANVDMTTGIANLKSSMDRFIDIHQSMYYQHRAFKIQYGQIYRIMAELTEEPVPNI